MSSLQRLLHLIIIKDNLQIFKDDRRNDSRQAVPPFTAKPAPSFTADRAAVPYDSSNIPWYSR